MKSQQNETQRSRRPVLFFAALLSIFHLSPANATLTAHPPSQAAQHKFEIQGTQFLLDGAPFQIISGEMHYPRIPRAEWQNRFRAAKAMGLNTLTAYVFWNVHEKTPGTYTFDGDANVAEFIREAQAEGLYVLLRPGPYVCAEWELGGLPSWLLKKPAAQLRTSDPRFIAAVQKWFIALGRELAPLQLSHGGPILAVQVENEYGSFGSDHEYLQIIRQALIDAGFGETLIPWPRWP